MAERHRRCGPHRRRARGRRPRPRRRRHRCRGRRRPGRLADHRRHRPPARDRGQGPSVLLPDGRIGGGHVLHQPAVHGRVRLRRSPRSSIAASRTRAGTVDAGGTRPEDREHHDHCMASSSSPTGRSSSSWSSPIVLILAIYKYVLPPVNKAMEERQEQIRTSLEAADQARADAEAADDERRGVLEEARQQAREIVATANRTAEQVRTDAQAAGRASTTASWATPRSRSLRPASGPSRRRPRAWARSSWRSSSRSSAAR